MSYFSVKYEEIQQIKALMPRCYELLPNTRQKSFYGKAQVIEQNGSKLLKSYNTIVCGIDSNGNFCRYWAGESTTTMRHINSFLSLFGVAGGGVKWWRDQAIVTPKFKGLV